MPVLKPLVLICENCHQVAEDPAMLTDKGRLRRVMPPPGWLVCAATVETLDDLAFCWETRCRKKAKEILRAVNAAFYDNFEGDPLPEPEGFLGSISPNPVPDFDWSKQ